MLDEISQRVDALFPDLRRTLDALIRIPSVSAPGHDPGQVRASAEATVRLFEDAGLDGVRLLELDGAHPAVFGERAGPEGTPTVLLYAHHDVQPQGDEASWSVPPFEPTERDGRLYGRGSSDDKAGIVTHVGAVRALGDDLPVNVKVFVEGEEEIGSANLPAYIDAYGDLLAADVIVIADSAHWKVGVPAFTTSLRGLVSVIVDVEVLQHAVHSGLFGGAVPDALTVMARILAGLHDEHGSVAVGGIADGPTPDLDLDEAEIREQAGIHDGVELIGTGTVTSRLWTKPAVSVLAIDAPPVAEAINALVPRARAKVSMRIPPGQDADAAMRALIDHIESQPAWGARVTATPHESGEAFLLGSGNDPRADAVRTAYAEAWGSDVVDIGVGGSIPFVAAFADRYPDATILLTGVGEPSSRAHGPDESMDLGELRRGIVAEAIALRNLGR